MEFSNEFIEKIVNETFPGLTFYYRDADLEKDIIARYSPKQILRNGIFLDMSSLGGRLERNTRFLIASAKATPLYQINPEVEKWRLHTIGTGTYFQVLDIIKENGKTQILLIQIPKEGVPLFQSTWINILDRVVAMGKESFEKKQQIEPIPALQEAAWLERTKFPVGLDGTNRFFDV